MYYVYGLQPIGKPEGPIKIGFSNKPTDRLEALEPGALGERLHVVFQIEAGDTIGAARRLEHLCHKEFASFRMNGEWFRFTSEILTWLPAGKRRIYGETRAPAINTQPAPTLDVGDTSIFANRPTTETPPRKELPTAGDLSDAVTIQKVVQRSLTSRRFVTRSGSSRPTMRLTTAQRIATRRNVYQFITEVISYILLG